MKEPREYVALYVLLAAAASYFGGTAALIAATEYDALSASEQGWVWVCGMVGAVFAGTAVGHAWRAWYKSPAGTHWWVPRHGWQAATSGSWWDRAMLSADMWKARRRPAAERAAEARMQAETERAMAYAHRNFEKGDPEPWQDEAHWIWLRWYAAQHDDLRTERQRADGVGENLHDDRYRDNADMIEVMRRRAEAAEKAAEVAEREARGGDAMRR